MFPCIEALFLPGLRGYVTSLTGRERKPLFLFFLGW